MILWRSRQKPFKVSVQSVVLFLESPAKPPAVDTDFVERALNESEQTTSRAHAANAKGLLVLKIKVLSDL